MLATGCVETCPHRYRNSSSQAVAAGRGGEAAGGKGALHASRRADSQLEHVRGRERNDGQIVPAK